jgi:hypothetical protein
MPSHALTRPLAVLSITGAVIATVLIGALHVTPRAAWVDPVRRPLSEYALHENGWVFGIAVSVLAAGSLAGWAALVGARLMAPASLASVGLLLWSVGMAGVVAFPKHNWSLGPSVTGNVHRAASVLGALSLPLAALLLARAWRAQPHWRTHALRVGGLGLLCLLCFTPIVVAVVVEPLTGVRWWRAIPLGAVERAMGASWILTVVALGWWAFQAGSPVVAKRANVAMVSGSDG